MQLLQSKRIPRKRNYANKFCSDFWPSPEPGTHRAGGKPPQPSEATAYHNIDGDGFLFKSNVINSLLNHNHKLSSLASLVAL